MKISRIYEKYKIMPSLQSHMFRVTAVASIICDNFLKPIDKNSIIAATLLHDIGNIVKFKLQFFPEFLEPKGLAYWKKVQQGFIHKYGKDDYKVTYKILKEIGVEPKVFSLIKSMEFKKAPANAKHKDFEKKICQYSDLRVAPLGVLSLNQRLREVQNRFMRNKGISEESFSRLEEGMRKIEKQIFLQTKTTPNHVTDQKVKLLMDKFSDFEIGS